MAIKLVISDTVKFQVKGVIRDGAGVDQPFGFSLICKRLDAETIQAKLRREEDSPLADFFAEIIEDWSGVKDAEDHSVPYTAENLRALFKLPGIAAITFKTYLTEVGAREKN